MKDKELDILLEKWSNAKSKAKELEDKCEKYKKLVEKIMDKNNKSVISSSNYTVTKREMTKTSLSKQNVPKDIWEKYSNRVCYPAFYLQKK